MIGYGAIMIALTFVYVPAVVVGGGVIGIDPDGLIAICESLIVLGSSAMHDTTADVGASIFRINLDGCIIID